MIRKIVAVLCAAFVLGILFNAYVFWHDNGAIEVMGYLQGSRIYFLDQGYDLFLPLWAWVAVALFGLGASSIRGKKRELKHRIEILLMGEGVNVHRRVDLTDSELRKEYTFKNSDKTYSFKVNDLWAIRRSALSRSFDRRIGLASRWLAVYEKDKTKPLLPKDGAKPIKKTIKDDDGKDKEVEVPEITAELLFVVERSTILRSAFKGMFKTAIGGKKIIAIIAIGIAIVFAILVLSGRLKLDTILERMV